MPNRGRTATPSNARRGRIGANIRNATNPQAAYYRSGGASAFGGGTIRDVTNGNRVVRGNAKS